MTEQKKKSKSGPLKKKRSDSILLIGAGRMGTALLEGWAEHHIRNITVVEPKQTNSLRKFASTHHMKLASNIDDLPKNKKFNAVVVAIKPQVLKAEISSLKAVTANATVISIAAGATTKNLKKAWGSKARIVRAMPNTPGKIGRGITGFFMSSGAGPADERRAKRLLSALGQTISVKNEGLIDSITAVSGSGPAYVFHMVEALTASGITQGLRPVDAERLARATIVGAGALLAHDKRPASELREEVTSQGGTTEAGLKKLRRGMTPLMERTVKAARERSEKLR